MEQNTLKFDENGLIPAIVQDHYTKEVLTLAYMNAESLAITLNERRTWFFSRSRPPATPARRAASSSPSTSLLNSSSSATRGSTA